jgi:hypothetical protein
MVQRGVLLVALVSALFPVPVATAGEDPDRLLGGSGTLHPREFFPRNSETATYRDLSSDIRLEYDRFGILGGKIRVRYRLEGRSEDPTSGEARICKGEGGSDGIVVGAAGLVPADGGRQLMGVGTAWHFSFFNAAPGSDCPSQPRELVGGSPFRFTTDRRGRAQGTLDDWSRGLDASFDVKFAPADVRAFQRGARFQAVAGFVGARTPRLCSGGTPVTDEQVEQLYLVLGIGLSARTPRHFVDVEVVEAPEPPWGAFITEEFADGSSRTYRVQLGDDGDLVTEEIDPQTGEPLDNPPFDVTRPERTTVRVFLSGAEPVALRVDTTHQTAQGNTCDTRDVDADELAASRLPF